MGDGQIPLPYGSSQQLEVSASSEASLWQPPLLFPLLPPHDLLSDSVMRTAAIPFPSLG